MAGQRNNENGDPVYSLDLQSVLHETNQLTISANENTLSSNIPKKYKKKKVHDDRKRSLNQDDLNFSKSLVAGTNLGLNLRSKAESDGEDGTKVVRRRRNRQKRMETETKAPADRFECRASSENESYQADSEMGGAQDDGDFEPVFDHVVDFEMCADSTSSIFDDSSHSESNNRDGGDGCDGDDELTDVEGTNHKNLPHLIIRSRLNATGAMPSRHMNQISALMESNTSTWSHIKANRLPGLVARSIRHRVGNRRSRKMKTIQSVDDPDAYDFSSIEMPLVKFKTLNFQKKRKTTEIAEKSGESSKKISRDSF